MSPLIIILIIVAWPVTVLGTALDDYVAAPDPNYGYNLINTISGSGYTVHILDMTSQEWRSSAEVDRTLWQHWLIIVKPALAFGNKALLFIDGGSNGGSPPTSADNELVTIALLTNTVVAHLKMVPNQPLTFTDETNPRSEDKIIAYTFDKYMTTGDNNWPALLPMVKSAVKGMDAVHDYVYGITSGSTNINKFVLSGASKRGWTTWLTAAVDSRVIGIIPAVFDALNLDEQMIHHYAAYGFYSPAIQDYVDLNIMDRLGAPEGQDLLQIVDPYEYRYRYGSIPKYMINSTGDQFFLPDSAQFYFDDLPGEKHLRYVPNTDHSLNDPNVAYSMLEFYSSILAGSSRPQYSWTIEDNDSIRVQTIGTPTTVRLWKADAPDARDFRLETIGPAWSSSTLSDQGGGVYIGQVPLPEQGWTGFFVELTYEHGGISPYIFTTEIHVVPERLPFACRSDFDGDSDVDQEDFGHFQLCLSGEGNPPAAECVWADLDSDNDVDENDFTKFQNCMNGPNVPHVPSCEED